MHLPNLRGLHNAMRAAGITRYKWRFDRGPATFEVIFIAEESPFELLLGAIGTTFGATILVHEGFRIDCQLNPDDYRALCRVLQLTFDPTRTFKPADFFAHLNNDVPQTVDLTAGRVRPHDVVAYRRNVDTSDGTYYCGWRDNTPAGNRVQASNLLKTLAVFGQRVHDTCRARNISTCWTHNIEHARDFDL
jgi:hypothetical protein